MILFCAFAVSCTADSFCFAHYPSPRPNRNLRQELSQSTDRLIPEFSWFSVAVDGQLYLRPVGEYDFYHGLGYWIQGRTEIRPNRNFQINTRSVFYSGSISGGYIQPTEHFHLLSLYGIWPRPVFNGVITARAMDLERQTLGAGLLIEERETAGLWLMWHQPTAYFRILVDGTGGLMLDDDMNNLELQLMNGLLGAGAIIWTAPEQSGLEEKRDPYYYVTSTWLLWERLRYAFEFGRRNDANAWLLSFHFNQQWGDFKLISKLQARHYDDLFADDFVGRIQHVYVTYDQYNKSYTNAINIFTTDDDVDVYSAQVDTHYQFSSQASMHFLNEVGTFNYAQKDEDAFYFFRLGFSYAPHVGRSDALTLFYSNKVLNESHRRPPEYVSFSNIPLFRRINHVGIEASFHF